MHTNIQELLTLVGILKKRSANVRPFNVFSALGCESDEVFLHSRLLSALIDPGQHALGQALLDSFLEQAKLKDGGAGFRSHGARIDVEYRDIDILITNTSGQAVIIENKIYAADQPKQLRRYYDLLRNEGFVDIQVRYLTLDGRDASADSLSGLDEELGPAGYQCLSYATDIRIWLDRAAAIAVRDVGLRETIFQYQATVEKLSGEDQGTTYMNDLVTTLTAGKNILLGKDIAAAYTRALAALQEQLWLDVMASCEKLYPVMYSHLLPESIAIESERKLAIAKYYEPAKRDKRYYGLRFTLPGYSDAQLRLDIDYGLYTGVYCDDSKKEYRVIAQVIKENPLSGESTDTWPIWRFVNAKHDFEHPDDSLLMLLADPVARDQLALACGASLHELWQALVD